MQIFTEAPTKIFHIIPPPSGSHADTHRKLDRLKDGHDSGNRRLLCGCAYKHTNSLGYAHLSVHMYQLENH